MFVYEKKLQYPVRIKNPNPTLAKLQYRKQHRQTDMTELLHSRAQS